MRGGTTVRDGIRVGAAPIRERTTYGARGATSHPLLPPLPPPRPAIPMDWSNADRNRNC